jgi:predicted nucleic acid-binding protein
VQFWAIESGRSWRSTLRRCSLSSRDFAILEAREHLPTILSKRGAPEDAGFAVLDSVIKIVHIAGSESYEAFERSAKRLLARRDIDDWPILATALALKCPIWTEDADFFGAGVATWTTDRVEFFLEDSI